MLTHDLDAFAYPRIFKYSDRYDTVISADEGGFIEIWQPFEPFGLPKNIPGFWSFKSETDLYEFKKVVSITLCNRTAHLFRRNQFRHV